VLGNTFSGTFAEEALFREVEVCAIPEKMDFNIAACFYLASRTAYYSLLDRAGLKAGETVLILGAGSGVGLLAIDLAKAVGAKVIASASSLEKLGAARAKGADVLIKYSPAALDLAAQKDFSTRIRHAAGGVGPNIVLDLVGGTYAEPAMRAMALNGRYASVGFSAGIPSIPMHVIFNKNGTLLGIEAASGEPNWFPGECPEATQRMLTWYSEGKLVPVISDVLPLDRAAVALRRMLDRKTIGRLVLSV